MWPGILSRLFNFPSWIDLIEVTFHPSLLLSHRLVNYIKLLFVVLMKLKKEIFSNNNQSVFFEGVKNFNSGLTLWSRHSYFFHSLDLSSLSLSFSHPSSHPQMNIISYTPCINYAFISVCMMERRKYKKLKWINFSNLKDWSAGSTENYYVFGLECCGAQFSCLQGAVNSL